MACIKATPILLTELWCISLLCLFGAPTLKVLSNLCCTIPNSLVEWCLPPPIVPAKQAAEILGEHY